MSTGARRFDTDSIGEDWYNRSVAKQLYNWARNFN
jgi:hypothetical protein